jgi:hypothetical protein
LIRLKIDVVGFAAFTKILAVLIFPLTIIIFWYRVVALTDEENGGKEKSSPWYPNSLTVLTEQKKRIKDHTVPQDVMSYVLICFINFFYHILMIKRVSRS